MMVVDTVSTSFIAHHLLDHRGHPRRAMLRVVNCRPLATGFAGRRLVARQPPTPAAQRLADWPVRALAVGVTKEASSPRREYRRIPGDGDDFADDDLGAPNTTTTTPSWPPRNRADDPSLHNPLLRLERMGCGWLGVIFEWEGVIVEDDTQLEKQAWLTLAEEEGKSPPPAFVLKRVEGMKTEHAIAEVLCWSRDPPELRRLAARKEEIHRALCGGSASSHQMRDGSREFMSTLANYKIPLAVASTRPRKVIEESIEAVGARGFFDAVVAAEDVYRGKPDPELFLYAAQLLRFIPERCIVFGNSNSAVEAAHDARMKCVAVASKHPVYELGAADLVVKQLDELSIVDLKNLAAVDDSAEFGAEPEPEMEEEEDGAPPSTAVGVADDIFL